MSKTFETEDDLKNETKIMEYFCDKKDYAYYKTKKYDDVDFAVMSGGSVQFWVEVKRRYNNMSKYKTLAISADKIAKGKLKSIATGLPFCLIIGWDDYVGCIEIEPNDVFDIKIGGRRDRDAISDTEPMVHIPINFFKII